MVGTRPCKVKRSQFSVHAPGEVRLKKVGMLLTEARSRRGVNISAAARDLRIPERHLRALEEGDLSVFAAEIYAKGAFTKYAQYLGIHAQNTQHAFQRVLSEVREFVPLRVHKPKPWLAAVMTPSYVLAAAMAGVAALVGAYVAWQVMSFVRLPDLQLTGPARSVAESGRVTVEGRAASDSVVYINGEQVLMNGEGDFKQEMNLHEGINVVQVAATNAAGRTRTVTRDILFPRAKVVP